MLHALPLAGGPVPAPRLERPAVRTARLVRVTPAGSRRRLGPTASSSVHASHTSLGVSNHLRHTVRATLVHGPKLAGKGCPQARLFGARGVCWCVCSPQFGLLPSLCAHPHTGAVSTYPCAAEALHPVDTHDVAWDQEAGPRCGLRARASADARSAVWAPLERTRCPQPPTSSSNLITRVVLSRHAGVRVWRRPAWDGGSRGRRRHLSCKRRRAP